MISQFFGIRKKFEDSNKIVYITTRTYWIFIPFILFIFSLFFMITIPIFGRVLIISVGLIIFEVILWWIVTSRIFWSKIKGKTINYKSLDYSSTEITILNKNPRGFLKYKLNYDFSALRGNTKGLNKTEKGFTNFISKLFGIR